MNTVTCVYFCVCVPQLCDRLRAGSRGEDVMTHVSVRSVNLLCRRHWTQHVWEHNTRVGTCFDGRAVQKILLMHQPAAPIPARQILSSQSSALPQSIGEVLICCALVCLCRVHCLPVLWFRPSLKLLWTAQHGGTAKSSPLAEREEGPSAPGSALYTLPLMCHSPRHCKSMALHYYRNNMDQHLACTYCWFMDVCRDFQAEWSSTRLYINIRTDHEEAVKIDCRCCCMQNMNVPTTKDDMWRSIWVFVQDTHTIITRIVWINDF